MRSLNRMLLTVGMLSLTVSLAACGANSVHRPMWRSEQYRAAVADYKTATVLPSERDQDNGDRVWKQSLPADSPMKATITGRAHLDIIAVTFPDGSKPQLVHQPADYTNNLEIRVKGSTLYVYRAVTLVWTEYRLAVYDLAKRKRQADWLVAPEDMPPRAEGR